MYIAMNELTWIDLHCMRENDIHSIDCFARGRTIQQKEYKGDVTISLNFCFVEEPLLLLFYDKYILRLVHKNVKTSLAGNVILYFFNMTGI